MKWRKRQLEGRVKRRNIRKTIRVGANDARRALQALMKEGRITARDVERVLGRFDKRIAKLRRELSELTGESIAYARKAGRRGARVARRAVRRLSRQARANLQLQGKYMAAVRALPKIARAKIKAIRKSSGVRAAIAAAKKMAG
jgi:hypothetical protein